MSVLALNRIRILEEKVAALTERLSKLEERSKTQACEERPHTLSLKKQKADSSHA